MEINTEELIKRTGVSRRQVNYWLSEDVFQTTTINNPGSGYPRKFDEEIVEKVCLLVRVAKAVDHTFRTELLKKVYDNYEAGTVEIGDGISLSWR